METNGSRGDRLGNTNQQKSSFVSPEKVREVLNEGVSSPDSKTNSSHGELNVLDSNSISQSSCEATNKEAFFSRVESYSCLRWAGKPQSLSPLRCARYGWISVGCDMLKCSSCQAFLCASLQPTLSFKKYESRIAEISRQLQTQHETFCPWPDFPCPERFWLVPASEPSVILTSFLERFQSACLLEQQLPALKPEQLKSMSLTEDVISVLLQLIEEEQKKQGATLAAEHLSVQVAACVVSLCGWGARGTRVYCIEMNQLLVALEMHAHGPLYLHSPALHATSLPILACSLCMRKVGLWNFHQMEGAPLEDDAFVNPPSPSAHHTPVPPPAVNEEEQGDPPASPSPTNTPTNTPTAPCRMKLRSQDTSRCDQGDSPSSAMLRTRTKDSPSPSEELPSPLGRGKRPATRSRCGDGTTGPTLAPKRLRLSSAGGPEGPLHRNAFDPLAQHRAWCPWVNVGKENADPGSIPLIGDATMCQQGWKAAMELLLPMNKCPSTSEGSPAQGPHDKSNRVFAIFRQWQVSTSSQ